MISRARTFKAAFRGDVAVGPLVEELSDHGDPGPTPSAEDEKGRADGVEGDELAGQAVVEGALDLSRVHHAGEIDECPGHAGGVNALDHRQVFRRQ